MTDRELLELAAKAAGQSQTWNEFWRGMYNELPGDCWDSSSYWNPLTSDGDALRLAVKLGIMVDPYHGIACVRDMDFTFNPHMIEATRRAIVRAAAEIGKELK